MTSEKALLPQSSLRLSWELIDDDLGLKRAVTELAAHDGPFALDTERASGYRYFSRAYLIQIKRGDSAIFLIDPIEILDLEPLRELLNQSEWILHSAPHDLPCLAELGLRPKKLFDTELAGRLLGKKRTALGKLVAEVLHVQLEKKFSDVDWSLRPLHHEWLEYAAIDVEFLADIRENFIAAAKKQNKTEIFAEEFAALLEWQPKPKRADQWRRTSHITKVNGDNRALAIVKELWLARDALAREMDVEPTLLLRDSAIIAAAEKRPRSENDLVRMRDFRGTAARTEAGRWWRAIRKGKQSTEILKHPPERGDSEASLRRLLTGRDADPVLRKRLTRGREIIAEIADEMAIQPENLLEPAVLKRLIVRPPETPDLESLNSALRELGARNWQVEAISQKLRLIFVDSN
ncbi:HRDC domain-containing protein [Canibacter zhoujuaniae]|uniref:HRDC domain-containing protein n=1 Tax=Canibacter zhoujuaniae TaxID=2708343 RepID=UPI0014233C91|nr:HRDC domain-containing protein [Canibacter zhoujuaniae]